MHQISMTGEDWMSDRDKRAKSRAEAARRKAAIACAKKLHDAADALGAFAIACLECNDASAPRRADDGRTLLASNMRQYAGWLESVYRA